MVGVDAGFETPLGDESLAVDVRLDGVDVIRTKGVAFLRHETFIVPVVGFVDGWFH